MMRRWRRFALVALLAAATAAGLLRLRLDTDILSLLPADAPGVAGLRLWQRHFAGAQELLVTVRGADADASTRAAQAVATALRARPDLVRRALWQPPWQEDPGGAAKLLAWQWLQQPPETWAELRRRLAPETLPATLADARDALAVSLSPQELALGAYDPLGLTRLPGAEAADEWADAEALFSPGDGALRVVSVQPAAKLTHPRAQAAWLAEVGAVAGAAGAPAVVRFTGGPAIAAETASGMQRDMTGSALGSALLVAALFARAHRSWRPLAWILGILLLTLALVLALGGALFGALNVVSLGFAAILFGLAADYGLVLQEEFHRAPDRTATDIRREQAPAILWSAATTATAFVALTLGGLPGLTQLGVLVGFGVLAAAGLMLATLGPRVTGRRREAGPAPEAATDMPRPRQTLVLTLTLAAAAAALLAWRPPGFDASTEPLRPVPSESYAALDELQQAAGPASGRLWLVVSGPDESTVAARLDRAQPVLEAAQARGEVSRFILPTALWPRPARAAGNAPAAQALGARREEILAAARQTGFTDRALLLADRVLAAWAEAEARPAGDVAAWALAQAVAHDAAGWHALAAVTPARPAEALAVLTRLEAELGAGFAMGGWDTLGGAMQQHAARRVPPLVAGIGTLVVMALALVFRRGREVVLSMATLVLAGLLLLAVMAAAGWRWNLMNLLALPLLLGAGVDYNIHLQLALRRHGGRWPAVRRTTGRAVLLCGLTTMAGFGSLAWSGNGGLASMGRVCAAGTACVLFVSLVLLPAWWSAWEARTGKRSAPGTAGPGGVAGPSALYGPRSWRLATWLAGRLPRGVLLPAARLAARAYAAGAPARVRVVADNLRPVVGAAAAPAAACRCFDAFAAKLVDVCRHEAGRPMADRFHELTGWEHFTAAAARGRGVLLVTPHLGNWELGAPLLAARGVRLLVLTQAEPGAGFTAQRAAARGRGGVETVVVGGDAFGFVEVIRRLEAGAAVALLVDRPPPGTGVTTEFFGRPFLASAAPAELARATGCAVVPVVLPAVAGGYAAQVLPELAYDRRVLGSREARARFAGEILRAFEPAVREHPEQWFHFVPVWPAS